MATPTVEEKRFGQAFYDDVVSWIDDNLEPNEVFDNAYLVEWIGDNLRPEEIFDDDALVDWALNYGMKEV